MPLLKSMLFTSFLCTAIAANAQTEASFASINSPNKKLIKIGTDAPEAVSKGKALTAFQSDFPQATEATWYNNANDASYVVFNTQGKTNRAMFNKKGRMLYRISYYYKEMLPASVVKKVNDTYRDKTIFGITEINYNNDTVYVLVLEDKTHWTNITIAGDNITDEKIWTKTKP